MFLIVVIKICKCAAHHDRIGLKLFDSRRYLGQVNGHRLWILDQPQDVLRNVITRHSRDLSLEFELGLGRPVPVFTCEIGDVRIVAQQVVDDQNLGVINALFDRLVPAVRALVVRKRQFFRFC